MLLSAFIKESTSSLEALYPSQEARSIVLLLCEAQLGTPGYLHIVEPGFEIPEARLSVLQEAMERLEKGEPVQYVIGYTEFYGRRFKVGPSVLIPRQETELLVKEAIELASRIQRMRIPYGRKAESVRILDLCTGSGCIAWSLALAVPGCRVVAVDKSKEALELASGQSFRDELKSSGALAPVFVEADVLDTEQDFKYGEFDLILSNPPYVRESEKSEMRSNVLDYEPAMALFVPDDDPLVFYRAIARWSERFLAENGKGLTEINESLGEDTEAVFSGAGFAKTDTIKDLNDKNRIIFYSR
jgi:release factor glutamine methyltransferase